MAKIVPFLGNISGKIAGNVFASNKGGAYIRQFVKPTNANSPAQQRARAAFSAGSRAWATLTSTLKSAWNEFASSSFSPKIPKSGVTYSGASAYSSLLNQAKASQASAAESVLMDATPTDLELLAIPFTTPTTPPLGKFTGRVTDSTLLISAPLEFMSAELSATTGAECKVTISCLNSGIDPTVFAGGGFIDPVTAEPFGFSLYVSKRIPAGAGRPSQLQKFLFATIPPFSVVGPVTFPEGPSWTLVFPNPGYSESSKYSLNSDDTVSVDCFAISASGSSVLLGSANVTLT